MDPIITPFTKCFCTSGYITRTGILLMMISEYFITSISCCFSCSAALAAAVVAVWDSAVWFVIRMLRRTSCSGYFALSEI